MARTGDSLLIGRETRHLCDTAQLVPRSHRPAARRCGADTWLAGLVFAVVVSTGIASAQAPQADQRWYPWIGCWSSSQNGLTGAASRVCVVPAAGTSAVDLVTVANGRIASREHIDANGQQRPSERDGCTGWESARWSADGRRLYVNSEHQCAAGGQRESEGLIAISPQGDWLDVVSVTLGSNTGVRVLRHRPTIEPTDLPAEVATALKTTPAARLREARTAAVAPIGYPGIVDASHQVSASVVAAWLNDVREDLPVDGKRLVELADAGVPERVIDMLVALAYPTAFSVPPSPTSYGALASDERSAGGGAGGFAGVDTYVPPSCVDDFSVFGFGGCAPYGYAPYGYYPYGYGAYGYLPYYGFGALGAFGGYGGWYATPPVVIVRPGDNLSHGQAINGRGYTSGNSGTPRRTNSDSSSGSGNTSSGSGSSSSGSGTTSSAPSGGGSTSSGGDRTAHPR